MDRLYTNNDNLLFGLQHTAAALSTLHPDPVQIFRLWQIYLNNIDPLLKVTHAPTLQGRLIEAASDLENVTPSFEALMFSIYAMSVMSLTADECQTSFNSSRDDLLTGYQFACQQALLNCDYLRTRDRECLTAFVLFLVNLLSLQADAWASALIFDSFQLDLIRTLDLCHPCWALRCELHPAWKFTASQA